MNRKEYDAEIERLKAEFKQCVKAVQIKYILSVHQEREGDLISQNGKCFIVDMFEVVSVASQPMIQYYGYEIDQKTGKTTSNYISVIRSDNDLIIQN